jgi:DNA-binding response OmpR family regulator
LTRTDVAVLHWPAQADEAEALAALGHPRLLLVATDADPPISEDSLCEWVRLPAEERDVAARVLVLARRLGPVAPQPPSVDANDRLLFGDAWVALSPIEARLASALAENFEAVVPHAELGRRGWPSGSWGSGALRVHLTRLRQRLAPLGLEVRAVRLQGFILQPVPLAR